jgi:hypothetical protein
MHLLRQAEPRNTAGGVGQSQPGDTQVGWARGPGAQAAAV